MFRGQEARQFTPEPLRHLLSEVDNPARQHRDPRQEDFVLLQLAHRLVKEDAGTLIREPGTRIEPTDQRERRPAIAPLAVLPDGANLQGMFLASFALLVAGQRGGMGDPQLAGQVGDHARGHLKEITHETAQIPRGAELDRKPSRLWSPRRSPSRSQSSASK